MTIILMIIVYYFQKIKSCLAEFKKLIPVLSFKEKGNVYFLVVANAVSCSYF